MKKFAYWIPSTLTLLNLVLGFVALALNHPVYSLTCILIGCLLDVSDGLVARLLKATSDFGRELDSLADIVTFGVVPAALLYRLCLPPTLPNILLVALLPLFSAIRLAKFNTDESQRYHFSGLPTPANGLFIASLPYVLETTGVSWHLLVPVILFFCLLLVAPLHVFAFKRLGHGGPDTVFPLLFLALTLLASFFLGLLVIPAGVLLYLILSVFYHFALKHQKPTS